MADSKKANAVSELFEQQDKLANIHPAEFETWTVTTTEIIRTHLGDESGFYTMMKSFDFKTKFTKTSTDVQDITVNT